MRYRFDMSHKSMAVLLAALLVAALIVPACMTVACIEAPMSGSSSMGGMSIADCLGAGVPHDGLLAADASSLAVTILLVTVLGFMLPIRHSASLSRVAWVMAPKAVGPAPPLDPRGERLLV